MEIVEGVREQLVEKRFQAGYIEDRHRPYVTLSRLLVEMGRFEDALLVAEKLRARSYLELVGEAEPRRAFNMPPLGEVPEGTVLVEYLIDRDDLLAFAVRRHRVRAVAVPVASEDLRAKVELLRDLLARAQGSEWEKPAASLYRLLIAPLADEGVADAERLVFVPHGILHYLPFAALIRPGADGPRFLIEDHEVSYLPSLAVLASERGEPRETAGQLLAVAPRRSRLAHAEREARDVAELYPRERLLLVGRRATASAFKKEAPRYRILHLATHGEFHKIDPSLSGLELEDGRLEVREILGLRLQADLVVLSACETALGGGYFAEVPAGDDFVGLTRAFLSAGSRSVVASLWRVDDRSTARLMGDFHRRYRRSGAAAALAGAQRTLLAAGEYRHPYFWAPFVLMGE